MTERDEYTPSLEALRREFEYRIRTAVTYGLGRGEHGDSADQDVAGWIDREIDAAMASLTLSQVIEAVRQEAREKTLRDYAQNRYLAFLEHPEVPWLEQPEGTARQYAKVAADMIAEADRIRRQGKEQDR